MTLSGTSGISPRRVLDPVALLEHLATAGEWLLATGFRGSTPATSAAHVSSVIRRARRGSRCCDA